jgi:Flp pilus assembly protein TadD
MIFAAGGIVFGFVLGYMAANYGSSPTPAAPPSSTSGTPARSTSTASTSAGKASPSLDPSEVRALTALADKEKDNVTVRVELGNLLMDHDRCEEAVRWYGEAVTLAPKNPDVRVDMGACLVRLTRYDDALAQFDQALQIDPAHKKAVFNKGVALAESGRPKEAIAIWEDLLKRNPDDPQLQTLRGHIDRLKGRAAS